MGSVNFARSAVIPTGVAAVTKSDVTTLPSKTVGLYIGVTGAVTVDMWGEGSDIQFLAVQAGTIIDGNFKRVKDATAATDIVCLYLV